MLNVLDINYFLMKNLLYGAGCLLLFSSCASQSALSAEQVAALANSQQFSFQAQRVQPLDASVNQVMTQLPNGSASQLYNLSYGYGIEVRKEKLSVYLPYFGQNYRPTFNDRDGGIKLETTDFDYKISPANKGYRITLTPRDSREVQMIYMDISRNGSASVSLSLSSRSAISYTGYISALPAESK